MSLGIFQRSDLSLTVLSILRSQSLHGYGIAQEIKKLSDGKTEVQYGTLYPLLKSLEKSGVIKGEPGLTERKRKITIYSLTPKGYEIFEEEKEKFSLVRHIIDAALKHVKG
jgi:DNA-binding PadR family transcriptional regulator